jgi:hypothetical protein
MTTTPVKSSQVNTLPNAKSQAKDKRAKDRQKYAALRCKVGVAPPGFEVRHPCIKSSQVNTLPKAKSRTRSKQNKDMHKCSSVYSERGVPLPVLTSGGE